VAVIDWRWNIVVGLWRAIPNFIYTRLNIPISSPDNPLPDGTLRRRVALERGSEAAAAKDRNP